MQWPSRSLVVGCALTALMAGCGKRLPELITVVAADQVYYSDESRIVERGGTVIQDREAWRSYWGRVTGSESAPPSVNFGSSMLVAFNAGRMQAGDRIQILEVQSLEDEAVVRYRVEKCGTLDSEVYPVQIVRVATREGPFKFEESVSRDPFCR